MSSQSDPKIAGIGAADARPSFKPKGTALAAAVGCCAVVASSAPSLAAVGVDSTDLREAVTVAGILEHQEMLQSIADDFEDTRASGTPGYDASAEYVADQLDVAGYLVTVQPFSFPFFQELSPAVLQQITPNSVSYVLGTDFLTMEHSGSDDITGLIQPTNDVVIPPGAEANTSTSGCEPEDFDGFVEGNVALVQRGTCTFGQKAQNAEAAGAAGVIIFNEGQDGRQEVLNGTLGGPGVGIPVVGTTFELGEDLYELDQSGDVTVRVAVDAISDTRNTVNVIGETEGGRDDRVVVVGAHLDSVPDGPGINDNGSGTATTLEIALQMASLDIAPRNKVRFAFWGAEESGLFGSAHYVSQLNKRGIKNVAVNLNFDMVGSPNHVRFVYDGDGSDTPLAGPNGSATIEDIFLDYFADQELATEPTAFDGRSDYGPFIDVGIPAGGLFTGAEEIKTAEQAAVYGGTAGDALDPCYHQACDDIDNNSNDALDEMSDAAAHTILQFAMTTSAVKGTSRAADRATKFVELDNLAYRGTRTQK